MYLSILTCYLLTFSIPMYEAITNSLTMDKDGLGKMSGHLIIVGPGTSAEMLPDCVASRNRQIGEQFRILIPKDVPVIVPQKPITSADVRDVLVQHKLADSPNAPWIYGSVLPEGLFARSTKAQVHLPTYGDNSPLWYDSRFAQGLEGSTVPGHTCFSVDGLRQAAKELFEDFPTLRVKAVHGASGEDQTVVKSARDVDRYIDERARGPSGSVYVYDELLGDIGIVVEANLANVRAWSVTETRLPGATYTSIGRQTEAEVCLPDGTSMQEYGGTTAATFRGPTHKVGNIHGIQVRKKHPEDTQTIVLDQRVLIAAQRHIWAMDGWQRDGIQRTRANVDVLVGTLVSRNRPPQTIVRTVEDSGRIGGASPEEALAIWMLNADPKLPFAVHSSRHLFSESAGNLWGQFCAQSPYSHVYWKGADRSWGGKYVMMCVY